MKRITDALIALVCLVALSPLLLALAVAVWADDPGPVLYRGPRVGRDGRPFAIYKFRSMRRQTAPGRAITVSGDPRVTRVGHWLRATKLDELPQLLNVLRGEMSLVGPRPEAPEYVALYSPEQRQVLAVRPGVTGLAQVYFRHEEELLRGPEPEVYYREVVMPAKLAIDLDYVRRRSPLLDLRVTALTLRSLVRPLPPPALPPPASAVKTAPAAPSDPGVPAVKAAPAAALPARHECSLATEVATMRAPTPVPDSASAAPAHGRAASLRAGLDFQVARRVRSYGPSVVVDVLVVAAAFEVATMLRFAGTSHMAVEVRAFLVPELLVALLYAVIAYALGLHRRLWRYASLRDGYSLAQAVAILTVVVVILDLLGQRTLRPLPLGVIAGGSLLSFLFLGSVKIMPRVLETRKASRMPVTEGREPTRVLIVGAGQAGAALANRLLLNRQQGHEAVAFVDDDPGKLHRRIHGTPIVGAIADIPGVVADLRVNLIAIAMPSTGRERLSEILAACQQTSASIKIVQSLQSVVGPQQDPLYLREVNIADLLGREVVPLRTGEAHAALAGKVVLVTGAAGSIGAELCRQLVAYDPARVVALDNNETGLFELAESLHGHAHCDLLRLCIGDITDGDGMDEVLRAEQPQIIFHAAAYKHVPLLEDHPGQAVRTNVLATYEMALLARQHAVECFVFVSSDKAADPINVLGASKRAGEIITQTFAASEEPATTFCAVRFGNVIGSRGSVVPTFLKQIEAGGPVTVTHPDVTRYFMTIPEACGLVIVTSALAERGGLFLLDMGAPVKIADLAVKMIRLRGLRVGQDVAVEYAGLRPGEKVHEVLAAPYERLHPTSQAKIFRVALGGVVLSQRDLAAWMGRLRGSLARRDPAAIRDELFEVVRATVTV